MEASKNASGKQAIESVLVVPARRTLNIFMFCVIFHGMSPLAMDVAGGQEFSQRQSTIRDNAMHHPQDTEKSLMPTCSECVLATVLAAPRPWQRRLIALARHLASA